MMSTARRRCLLACSGRTESHRRLRILHTATKIGRAVTLEAVRVKFEGESAVSSQTLIRQTLMRNVKFIDIDTTDSFIEPNVASLLVPEKGINSLEVLKDWISREDAKSILVLVGDGGMGKTTLVRQLANDLQRGPNRIYPILIESDQWRYALHSRLDLADIWDLAIRRSLSHNFMYHEDAFHTLVSEGIFVIIFDGFDELCLNPRFPGGPREIIAQLMSYIHSDDDDKPARILLTSRETYWHSTTGNTEYENDLEVYKLLGFNHQQRKNYFQTYFGKKEDSEEIIDTALRVSKEVGGKLFRNTEQEDVNAERLSGTPLILHLIAVALESGTTINPYEADPLDRILLGVCSREKRRQQLSIDENTQMEIFEELFRNDAQGIQEDDIQLCLDIYGEADALQDESQVARFRHHFFLVRDENGAYMPRYEVLRTYFISRFLARGLLESEPSEGARRTFIEHLAKNANVAGTTQITDWLVIQLRQHGEDILIDAFRKASEMLHEPISRSQTTVSQQRFAGQMLFKIVLQLLPSNIDKKSKRICLVRYLSNERETNHLSEMHFCGILEGFDFCGCKFSNSSFESSVFRNCAFDSDTTFEKSVFFGGLTFQNSTGQKMIVVDKTTCTMSDEADLTINQLRGRRQEKSRGEKLAEKAIVQALDQLRSRRGHGYIALN